MFQMSFLYIDEGPYMPSLEHLVQHYMHFSDGLPINLRYAVPPKPKPPLPLPQTIPRKQRKKTAPSDVIDKVTSMKDHRTNSNLELNLAPKYPSQRNMSIPSDDLMNTVGIAISPPDSKNIGKYQPPGSLKSKSPKKNNLFLEGMRSLRKNKAKKTPPESIVKNEVEEIPQTFKNLSFSTDFKLADLQTYNIPTNNSVVEDVQSRSSHDTPNRSVSQSDNQNNNPAIPQDYFVAGDNTVASDNNKGSEEIYFIDAPTMPKIELPKDELPSTSFQYVPFKHVPYFPDDSPLTVNNNNPLEVTSFNDPRLNRLDSTTSSCSMDSEYFAQHKFIDSRITTPNYFIPKSNLQQNDTLGEGEFGSVFKGVLKMGNGKDDLHVAIKTLHDEHCKQNKTEFLREASVMIKLSHHCIVKLIGISKVCPCSHSSKFCFVFKFDMRVGSTTDDDTRIGSAWIDADLSD